MSEVRRRTEIEGAVLQIRKIGNSHGFILSQGASARLKHEARATSFMSSNSRTAA